METPVGTRPMPPPSPGSLSERLMNGHRCPGDWALSDSWSFSFAIHPWTVRKVYRKASFPLDFSLNILYRHRAQDTATASFNEDPQDCGPYFNSLKRKWEAPNASSFVGVSMAMLLLYRRLNYSCARRKSKMGIWALFGHNNKSNKSMRVPSPIPFKSHERIWIWRVDILTARLQSPPLIYIAMDYTDAMDCIMRYMFSLRVFKQMDTHTRAHIL